MERVAVIGAGTMGSGIAQVFATHGFDVVVVDSSVEALERGREGIEGGLARLVGKGRMEEGERTSILARVGFERSLASAAGADFVVEAIVEDAGAKARVFAELDGLAPPHAVFASNTSSISITKLASATRRPDRVIGMHFMNPVPVMELVEVIRGEATSDAAHALTHELARRLEKTPVTVSDYPGFISNRILMPFINEAVFALMEGIGSRDDIDTVFRLGMRHPMGPLELADLIGLDICLQVLEVLHRGLGDPKYRPCPLLRRMVDAGHLGRKTGRGFHDYTERPAKAGT